MLRAKGASASPQHFYSSSIRAMLQLRLEENEMGCSVTQEPAPEAVLSLWMWGIAVGYKLTSRN